MRWLDSILSDLRSAIALLRRDRTVSLLIILVMALGIGGNSAVFTLLKAAFLDPLPYRDSTRLITIMENNGWIPSTSEFLEIRARSRTLEQVAFAEHRDMQLSGTVEPTRVFAARVSASFFRVLSVSASLGRTFLEEENQLGRSPLVVLTDAFWRSAMGADPHVIGRAIRLDAQHATIIGVLPPDFQFDYPTLRIPERVDVYVAYPIDPATPLYAAGSGRGIAVRVIGRLRAGVTVGQAAAELNSIGRALVYDHPQAYRTRDGSPSRFTFETHPLRDAIVGTQRSILWLLLIGVGVLLLIACANTAQLLLARSLRRGREIAIRAALGATRARLIRQLLLEGLVLAACGGAVGLLASNWIVRVVIMALPVRSPFLAASHLDLRVIGFTVVLALVSGIVFAMAPALKGSLWQFSLNARASGGEGNRLRYLLIAVEGALSVFLLCGAGLVAQNLWTLITTPVGFDPNHVMVMRLSLPARQQNLPDPEAKLMFDEYLKKISAIPGVDSAATTSGPPLRPTRGGPFEIEGETEKGGRLRTVLALSSQVSPDYFRTLRIPLLAGRSFRNDDAGSHISVAIVNQEAARRFGLDQNVVGRQIADAGPIAIVGIAGNVRARGLDAAPFPQVYLSSRQFSWANVYLVVRSALPAAQLIKQVKTAVATVNPDQAVFGATTMRDFISDTMSEPRFDVWILGVFALLAITMAGAGIYSVIACLVAQRTGEIAIRLALGANWLSICRTVLGATMAWLIAGLACGLGLALAMRNVLKSLSNASVPLSPWMSVAMVVFFFGLTLAAALSPLRKANQMDPAAALRCD